MLRPDELTGYAQCHFFAGVGVWSLALRRAGVPDDAPVWTGSCPCQPFSAAGEGRGFDDERHLWPAFFHLIEQCQPAIVLGEQVASADADPWIDLVCADLESLGYAFGATAFPSASVGAPHIRDRLYWVANAPGQRSPRRHAQPRRGHAAHQPERLGLVGGVAHANGERRGEARQRELEAGCAERPERGGDSSRLADADGERRASDSRAKPGICGRPLGAGGGGVLANHAPGPTNGLWRDADWLACRDGRWRPVEPGTFPLAHGAPARVGRLRAYGNAINAEAARVFIEAVMEAALDASRCRSLAGDQEPNVQEESAAHLPVRLLTGKEQ